MPASKNTIIDETARIGKGVELGVGVEIGPYCILNGNIKIGDYTKIKSHVVITGRTQIGSKNTIWPFATLGVKPQDLKYCGEDSELLIGDENEFREYSNMSIGTMGGGMKTKIGSKNLFMVYSHVAHDCTVGDHNVVANGVSLAGHVTAGSHSVIGGHVGVHQFCVLGDYCIIASGSVVVQDVFPYTLVHGNHAKTTGLNLVGLKRQNFTPHEIAFIKEIFKRVFHSEISWDDAKASIHAKRLTNLAPGEIKILNCIESFLQASKRGLCR